MVETEAHHQRTIQEDGSEGESPASEPAGEKHQENGTTNDVGIHDATKEQHEQDIENQDQSGVQNPNTIAGEDYSVFTTPQKRSIIVAGSFLAWFSPVSHSR